MNSVKSILRKERDCDSLGGDFADKKAQDLLMPAVEIYVIYFQLCCKC